MLRKAIITQAIIDAANISELRAAKKLEQEAKSWIFGDGEYFKTTCMEGDIEPSFVVRVTKEIIRPHRSKYSFRKKSQQNSVDSKNKKPSFKTKQ